jgi:20S proteasome alpha/beta subunit
MLSSESLQSLPCVIWRLPERKPMTLIAGLKCVDGIVLAADTEESTYLTRGRARKLVTRTFSQGKNKKNPRTVAIAIAGAGSAALIDTAVEQVFEAVSQTKGTTVRHLKTTIRDALLRFYRHDLSNYPTQNPLDNIIDLLCGVRAANGELALYRASGPLIHTVSGFALCGSGEIIRHVVEELYQPTIAVPRAVALVLHLLNLGKRYVTGVGGDSEILTLMTDGIPTQERLGGIRIKEQHLDHFNHLLGELLLKFPDKSITPEAFASAMTQIAADVQDLRDRQATELENEISRQPTSPSSLSSPPGQVSAAGTSPSLEVESPMRLTSQKGAKEKATRRVRRSSKHDR